MVPKCECSPDTIGLCTFASLFQFTKLNLSVLHCLSTGLLSGVLGRLLSMKESSHMDGGDAGWNRGIKRVVPSQRDPHIDDNKNKSSRLSACPPETSDKETVHISTSGRSETVVVNSATSCGSSAVASHNASHALFVDEGEAFGRKSILLRTVFDVSDVPVEGPMSKYRPRHNVCQAQQPFPLYKLERPAYPLPRPKLRKQLPTPTTNWSLSISELILQSSLYYSRVYSPRDAYGNLHYTRDDHQNMCHLRTRQGKRNIGSARTANRSCVLLSEKYRNSDIPLFITVTLSSKQDQSSTNE